MKSIQNQYRDLKEGRMSQANFMRNLRMTMPQYVTNVTSFNDAVKILRNKAILTEALNENSLLDEVTSEMENGASYAEAIAKVAAKYNMDKDKLATIVPEQSVGDEEYKDDFEYSDDYDDSYPTDYGNIDDFNDGEFFEAKDSGDEDAELEAMIKKMEDEKAGEEAVMSQFDPMEEELNEAKKKKEAKAELHPNKIHPQELRMGIRVELEHTDDLDKAKKIALDHLAENPFYYTALKLSGIESPSAPKVKAPKEAKVKKKSDKIELVDLVNQMQKVKMPKADEKKKLKETVEEKMMFQDLPADPEKYQIKKDMKGKIVQATNDEGNVFSMNDEATAIDNGEKIKIAGFKEEQGKVKAIFKASTGMFFSSIDIDGLKPINKGFRPGVNLGASFEKMKKSLEEVVREVLAEMQTDDQEIDNTAMAMDEYFFDGRDNLADEIAATEK